MFLLLGVCFRLINFVSSNVSLNLDTQCDIQFHLKKIVNSLIFFAEA